MGVKAVQDLTDAIREFSKALNEYTIKEILWFENDDFAQGRKAIRERVTDDPK